MPQLSASEIFRDAAQAIILIVSVDIQKTTSHPLRLAFVQVTPYAIVVTDSDRHYALDMDANFIDLGELLERTPDLKMFLDPSSPGA